MPPPTPYSPPSGAYNQTPAFDPSKWLNSLFANQPPAANNLIQAQANLINQRVDSRNGVANADRFRNPATGLTDAATWRDAFPNAPGATPAAPAASTGRVLGPNDPGYKLMDALAGRVVPDNYSNPSQPISPFNSQVLGTTGNVVMGLPQGQFAYSSRPQQQGPPAPAPAQPGSINTAATGSPFMTGDPSLFKLPTLNIAQPALNAIASRPVVPIGRPAPAAPPPPAAPPWTGPQIDNSGAIPHLKQGVYPYGAYPYSQQYSNKFNDVWKAMKAFPNKPSA